MDSPELAESRGRKTLDYVKSRLKSAPFILLTSTRSDKYDSYLSDVFIPNSKEVILRAEGPR